VKVTVFGATGGTGREFVNQAVAAGHTITAVVRKPVDLPGVDATVPADVLDPDAITAAVAEADAVVTAIGPRRGEAGASTICTDSVRSIIRAMNGAGPRRLLVVSNSGMITDDGDSFVMAKVVKPVMWRVLGGPWGDMLAAEERVRASALDWTLVRPPRLTNGRHTGQYRIDKDRNLRGGRTIARADVADYLVRALTDDTTIHRAVAVAH